jgi:hypothetical protein
MVETSRVECQEEEVDVAEDAYGNIEVDDQEEELCAVAEASGNVDCEEVPMGGVYFHNIGVHAKHIQVFEDFCGPSERTSIVATED